MKMEKVDTMEEENKPHLVSVDGNLLAPGGKEPPVTGNWLLDMKDGTTFLCRPKSIDGMPYRQSGLLEYRKVTNSPGNKAAYLQIVQNDETTEGAWHDGVRFSLIFEKYEELG